MGFMQKQVTQRQEWIEVETSHGTTCIPREFVANRLTSQSQKKGSKMVIKRQKEKEEAKRLLLEGKSALKPGSLLLYVVKHSRTGYNKRVKVYGVWNDPIQGETLLCYTRNIAVLMGLANTREAEEKAFRDGFLTDDGIGELSHYLSVKLFGQAPELQLRYSEISF